MRHSIYVKRALMKLKKSHKMTHEQLRAVAGILQHTGQEAIREGMATPLTVADYEANFKPEG